MFSSKFWFDIASAFTLPVAHAIIPESHSTTCGGGEGRGGGGEGRGGRGGGEGGNTEIKIVFPREKFNPQKIFQDQLEFEIQDVLK